MRDAHATPARRRHISVWGVGFTAFVTLVAAAAATATVVAGLTGTTEQGRPVGLMSIESIESIKSMEPTSEPHANQPANAPAQAGTSNSDKPAGDADVESTDAVTEPPADTAQPIEQSAPPAPASSTPEPRESRRDAYADAARDVMTFNGRKLEKVRNIDMEVTAYSPDARSCGKWADNQTASGYSVWTNGMRLVAADTDMLPFETIVTVPGYNDGDPVQVLDRGGAIKGKRLDVLYGTHDRAMQWGRQNVTVTVWKYAD